MNTESKAPATVRESWRVTLRCKYLPVTNHRGSRIKVTRWDSTTYGTDPNGITVGWDHSLNTQQNYAEAVRQYLLKAEWDGTWVVSLCADGAVAVYFPQEA